jgi:hypothetical protein
MAMIGLLTWNTSFSQLMISPYFLLKLHINNLSQSRKGNELKSKKSWRLGVFA